MKQLCLVMFILLISVSAPLAAETRVSRTSNWPQWRGPDGQGISTETGLPTEWSQDKNVAWKTPIPGRGHSSPVIWGNRIFLTTSIEGPVVAGAKAVKHILEGEVFVHPDSVGADRSHSMKVLCLDRETGKVLWEKTAYQGTVYDDRHRKSSYASSTPATDGRYLFAFFGSEGLYCYDLEGELMWRAAPGKLAQLGMGAATSPVLYQNIVILQCDVESGAGSFIVALDKKTGKEVWRVARQARASWTTPIVIQTPDHTELIVSGAEAVLSYDPATGKELWRCQGVEGHAIPTPVAGHNMVYVSAGYPSKHAIAIRPGGSGDLTHSDKIAWKYDKGTAYVPSPILYREYLYLMTDKGLLTCLDAVTGAVKYEGRRVPTPATFTASPVAFDGKILLSSEDGDTYVIKAGAAHEVLRTNSIGEPIYASPAISRGQIFIRGLKNLYCIGKNS